MLFLVALVDALWRTVRAGDLRLAAPAGAMSSLLALVHPCSIVAAGAIAVLGRQSGPAVGSRYGRIRPVSSIRYRVMSAVGGSATRRYLSRPTFSEWNR